MFIVAAGLGRFRSYLDFIFEQIGWAVVIMVALMWSALSLLFTILVPLAMVVLFALAIFALPVIIVGGVVELLVTIVQYFL